MIITYSLFTYLLDTSKVSTLTESSQQKHNTPEAVSFSYMKYFPAPWPQNTSAHF